jgi:glutaredoxin
VNRLLRAMCLLTAALLAGEATGGCRRAETATARDAGSGGPVVRSDSESLLLTWIDDKGDFHVETRVDDVPLMGRDTVRVQGQGDGPADPDQVFVADLRQAGSDGAYPVRTISRKDFEGLAVARREKLGPTLAGQGAPASSSASAAPPSEATAQGRSAARTLVTIYGAEWCGACHEAARYLRHKGIAYVEKDIEKDPAAAREMQEKLAKARLPAGSIPVIDVRGKVMVGFDANQIDAALGEAL